MMPPYRQDYYKTQRRHVIGTGYKNSGWQGELPGPDGSIMTQVSVNQPVLGVPTQMPLITPFTSKQDIQHIREHLRGKQLQRHILDQAALWASIRRAANKSPFYNGTKEDKQWRTGTTK